MKEKIIISMDTAKSWWIQHSWLKMKTLNKLGLWGDYLNMGLPQWLRGKQSTCNAGDTGSVPGLGRPPGEGHGNPL